MNILLFKSLATLLTFVVALIGGIFPLWHAKKHQTSNALFSFCQALASGIFLGAALLHMLPDANHEFNILYPSYHFPLANLIAAGGFVSLLLLEHLIEKLQHKKLHKSKILIHYLLIIVLSLHCFIEGTALGVNLSLAGALIIFIAIIAHKGMEGFAISSKLLSAHMPARSIVNFVLLIALMTPLGIIAGTFTSTVLALPSALLLEGIFNAFAAGSFLYIATMHTLGHFGAEEEQFGSAEISAVIMGLAAMAIIAIWL